MAHGRISRWCFSFFTRSNFRRITSPSEKHFGWRLTRGQLALLRVNLIVVLIVHVINLKFVACSIIKFVHWCRPFASFSFAVCLKSFVSGAYIPKYIQFVYNVNGVASAQQKGEGSKNRFSTMNVCQELSFITNDIRFELRRRQRKKRKKKTTNWYKFILNDEYSLTLKNCRKRVNTWRKKFWFIFLLSISRFGFFVRAICRGFWCMVLKIIVAWCHARNNHIWHKVWIERIRKKTQKINEKENDNTKIDRKFYVKQHETFSTNSRKVKRWKGMRSQRGNNDKRKQCKSHGPRLIKDVNESHKMQSNFIWPFLIHRHS